MIILTGDYTDEMTAASAEIFRALLLSGEASIEVVFVNEEKIRELNARTRGIDKVTDVLSYPALTKIMPLTIDNYPFDSDGEGRVFLGSVVICRDVAQRQAIEYGHSLAREETYLFTHGLLHLLGYDHIKEEDKRLMRETEERVLSAIGITRCDQGS